jgi:hypothetical protein
MKDGLPVQLIVQLDFGGSWFAMAEVYIEEMGPVSKQPFDYFLLVHKAQAELDFAAEL